MIATDLSKQQPLDADPKSKQQINFTGNLDQAGKTLLDFSQETVKILWVYFLLI